MSGPEHYKIAEDFLDLAEIDETGSDAERYNLAAAQVHATLALVAATVATRAFGPPESWGGHAIEVDSEWQQVTA